MTCCCEYPRWCTLISNRDYINDDIFEITSEEPSCCCKPKNRIIRYDYSLFIMSSEEFPEKVNASYEEVCEHDMNYLTIGIVVNAPYGIIWVDL